MGGSLAAAGSCLSKAYWEANWEAVRIPLEHTPRRHPELDAIFQKTLPKDGRSLVEIGCAPGAWLAYFARRFEYTVGGIEYAERAHQKTLDNLSLLGLGRFRREVRLGDFLVEPPVPSGAVFSTGFVEHFADLEGVVRRIVSWARRDGYVVTLVPSLSGLNWWISRRFRPEVAAAHFPVSLQELVRVHEAAGVQTCCARYYGCLQVLPLLDKTRFSKRHPRLARLSRLPFRVWNRLVRLITSLLRFYPQIPQVHLGLIYIGRRTSA